MSLFQTQVLLMLAFTGWPGDGAVERLASPDRAERITAERDLLEQGPAILDQLPQPSEIKDVAVRTALERIRKQLELQQADQVLEASRIVVQGAGPAGELVAGHVALTPAQSLRPVELASADDDYWKVIDDVARQINGWPARTLPDGQVTFRDRTPADERKRITYERAFRLAAGPAESKAVAGDPLRRLVRIPLELRAEPRLRPLFASFAANDMQLTGGDETAFRSFTPGAKYELPFGDVVETRLDFLAVGDVVDPLRLEGTLHVTVAAGEERFAFPLDEIVQASAKIAHGGVTVGVRRATRGESGTATVELAVVYDHGGPAFESHRTWVYHNDAALIYTVEQDGQTTEHRLDHKPGFSTIAQADGGVVLAYRFVGLPADARDVNFVYKAPTKIIDAPLTFKIDGLSADP